MHNHVRQAPISRLMHRDNASLFDHLLGGGKERLRDRKPQGFCGLEINHQFKLGWLNYPQIGGLCPSKDAKRRFAARPLHHYGPFAGCWFTL